MVRLRLFTASCGLLTALSPLDVPGASTAIGQGTFPKSINPSGEIAGFYDASHVVTRGFVREKGGKITTFDTGPFDTMATSSNPSGEVTGYFFGANKLAQGFMRAAKGNIVAFETLGSGGPSFGDGTLPQSINPGREVTGFYTDANGVVPRLSAYTSS